MPVNLDHVFGLLILAKQRPHHAQQDKATNELVKLAESMVFEIKTLREQVELMTRPHKSRT